MTRRTQPLLFAQKPGARWRGCWALLAALILLQVGLAVGYQSGQAASNQRVQVTEAFGSVNAWILKTWKDQALVCEIYVNHTGEPLPEEIQASCDPAVYQDWLKTPVCSDYFNKGETNNCPGAYLVYLGQANRPYQKVTILPQAKASFALANCPNRRWCSTWPSLRIDGVEPLSHYNITEVHLKTSLRETVCKGRAGCEFTLPRTTADGTWLEYWVVSSYGDESPRELLHVRNVYRKDNGGEYYLEILSSKVNWDFAAIQWGAFPNLEAPTAAFYGEASAPADLATQNHLYYLAGKLINTAKVDTQACPGGILLPNGMAGACGEEQAFPATVAWQNQYDQPVYQAASQSGLPPRILKGILAQESQFWPDADRKDEYGLGCLTENGIDALLVTDAAYFVNACTSLYDQAACAPGYGQLSSVQRAALRGLVLRAVGTAGEIDLVARVLRAQTVQVGQMVQDATGNLPGQVTSYEDLWDLSIAGYHAGSGCIRDGLEILAENDQAISFENYCSSVQGSACASACTFVEKVKEYMR